MLLFSWVSRFFVKTGRGNHLFQHVSKLLLGIFLYLYKKSQVFVSKFLFNFVLIEWICGVI